MNRIKCLSNPADRWLSYRKVRPQARLRLFCLPYSGAGGSIYCQWSETLPPAIEVCPVQLPGREHRLNEQPFTALTAVVPKIAEAIRPYLDKPFAFFGHSLGALLSFELARYLRREWQLMPSHLFVSGHSAPQLCHYKSPIHTLPEADFVARLDELNGMPDGVLTHPELRELLLPLLRADFTMCETYQYEAGAPLNCPLTALGGLADPYLDRADLESWGEQTSSFFKLRLFRGDHFYLHTERPLLLRILAQELLHPRVS